MTRIPSEYQTANPLGLKPFRMSVCFLIRTVGLEKALEVPPDVILGALLDINKEDERYRKYIEKWSDFFEEEHAER